MGAYGEGEGGLDDPPSWGLGEGKLLGLWGVGDRCDSWSEWREGEEVSEKVRNLEGEP